MLFIILSTNITLTAVCALKVLKQINLIKVLTTFTSYWLSKLIFLVIIGQNKLKKKLHTWIEARIGEIT